MAFSATPTGWFSSWAEDAINITVPIASFPGLTAATADGTTGDIRKIIYAVLDRCWAVWAALAVADRPAKMRMSKESSTDPISAETTHTYTFVFKTSGTGQDVVAE